MSDYKCEKCDGAVEFTGSQLLSFPPIDVYCCRKCNEVYWKRHRMIKDNEYVPESGLECQNYKHDYFKDNEGIMKIVEDGRRKRNEIQ